MAQIVPTQPTTNHPRIAVGPALVPAVVRIALLVAASLLLWGTTCGFGACRNQALLNTNATIVVVDLLCLYLAGRALSRHGGSLRTLLASDQRGRDILLGTGLFFALTIVFFAASYLGNLVAYAGPPPTPTEALKPALWVALIALVAAPFTIAVAEEVVYRGVLQPALSARWGAVVGVLVTAVVFGVQHVAFTLGDPQATVSKVITTFVAGLFLGFLRTKLRTLWPLIIAHWLLDLLFLGLPMLFWALS